MLEKNYKNIIYFIALAVFATIIAQVYWNVKNYEVNKHQINNQIKTSFDNAVEKYYSKIAKKDIYNIIKPYITCDDALDISIPKDNYTDQVWIQSTKDSVPRKPKKKLLQPTFGHSKTVILKKLESLSDIGEIEVFKRKIDSLDLKKFTTKILFSFIMDDVKLEEIDSLYIVELRRKGISTQHGFLLIDKNPLTKKENIKTYNLDVIPNNFNSIISNSPFVNTHSTLELRYTNTTTSILKRMLGSILLSLLFSIIIIGCLLFLLKIISNQKQLAEIKNDLINNITHEFKTPIATISVALESIKNFNAINDKEKTKNYLEISNNQLSKLNLMVEKLLETASLNSNNLNLQKEETDIANLLQTIIKKHQMQTNDKTLTFNKLSNSIFAEIDVFHFENAINNIIDNALKYGGNNISIELNQQKNAINISISDDGNSLKNSDKERIFEKFYRVSKRNTHDIKGFGIGLYYAKKIVEKHNGTIDLELKNNLTTFKISLLDE